MSKSAHYFPLLHQLTCLYGLLLQSYYYPFQIRYPNPSPKPIHRYHGESKSPQLPPPPTHFIVPKNNALQSEGNIIINIPYISPIHAFSIQSTTSSTLRVE